MDSYDEKRNKRKFYFIFLLVCAVSVVLEILFAHPHGDALWHRLPGADLIIAFVSGFAFLLLKTKVIGPLLQRDEDYYDREEKKDE